MAVTATLMTTLTVATDSASNAVTASWAASNNKGYIAFCGWANSTKPSAVSGNGLTWVEIASVAYGSRRSVTAYRALVTSGATTGATTFTGTNDGAIVHIFEMDGVDITGTNGSGMISNSATQGTASSSSSGTVTLTTCDAVLACAAIAQNNDPTWEGAYTEKVDTSEASDVRRQTVALDDDGGDLTPSATWSSASDGHGFIGVGLVGSGIGVRSSNEAELSTAGTSLTLTAPAGIVDDDILIAGIDLASSTGTIALTGWSVITNQNTAHDGGSYQVLYKVASSESGNYAFTWSGSSKASGWIMAVKGADTSTPFAASPAMSTGTDAAPDPPASGTVASDDYLAIASFGIEGKNSAGITAPSGYVLRRDIETTGGGPVTGHCGVGVATLNLSAATAENPAAFASSGSDGWAASTLLVSPVGGASAQNIDAALISSTSALYTPTVAAGAVNIDAPAIASGSTLYTPTVAVVTNIDAPFIASGSTLFTPTVAAGAVNIDAPAIASGSTLFTPTVAAGAVNIDAPFIAATSTTYAPTVTSSANIDAPFIASTEALYTPTVTPGSANIAAPAISSGSTLYTPTVSLSGAPQNIDAPFIASTSTTYTPTVTAGTVNIDAAAIASASTTYTPTVSAGAANIDAPFISSTTTIYTPSVDLDTTQNIDAPFISSGSALFTPTVSAGAVNIDAAFIASTEALYTPTIGSTVNVDAALISSTSALYTPTVDVGTANIDAPFIVSGSVLYTPSLAGGGDTSIVASYDTAADPVSFNTAADPVSFDEGGDPTTFATARTAGT